MYVVLMIELNKKRTKTMIYWAINLERNRYNDNETNDFFNFSLSFIRHGISIHVLFCCDYSWINHV